MVERQKIKPINLKVSGFVFSNSGLKCDTSNLKVVSYSMVQWAIKKKFREVGLLLWWVSQKFVSRWCLYFTYVFPSVTIGITWKADYSIFRIMLILSISFQSSSNPRFLHNMWMQLLLFFLVNTSISYFPMFQCLE